VAADRSGITAFWESTYPPYYYYYYPKCKKPQAKYYLFASEVLLFL